MEILKRRQEREQQEREAEDYPIMASISVWLKQKQIVIEPKIKILKPKGPHLLAIKTEINY